MQESTPISELLTEIHDAISAYQDAKQAEVYEWRARVHQLEQQIKQIAGISVATPKLERLVRVSPAWDRRSPNPRQDYGWRGMDLHWILRGSKGAVEWTVGTNWVVQAMVPETQSWNDAWLMYWRGQSDRQTLIAHAYVHQPQYPEGYLHGGVCEYLETEWCYCNEIRVFGEGAVQARDLYWILVEQSDAAFWAAMQPYYDQLAGPDVEGEK